MAGEAKATTSSGAPDRDDLGVDSMARDEREAAGSAEVSDHDGRYWSLSVLGTGGATLVRAGAGGVGLKGGVIEIKDRVTGEVGIFMLYGATLEAGFLPAEAGLSTGEAVVFTTGEPQTLRDFEGMATISGFAAGALGAWQGIRFGDDLNWPGGFDMDIKQDGFWATVWNGDNVDISAASSVAGVEFEAGVVRLDLIATRQEAPDPGLLDEAAEIIHRGVQVASGQVPPDPGMFLEATQMIDRGVEVAEHHLEGQTASLDHARAEVEAQQSQPWEASLDHDPESFTHAGFLAQVEHDSAELAAQQSLEIPGRSDNAAVDGETLYAASVEVGAQQSLDHRGADAGSPEHSGEDQDPFEGAGVGPLLDVTDDGVGPLLDVTDDGVGPLLDVTDDGVGPVLDDASLGPVVDSTAADDSPTNGSATASPVGDDDGVESGLDPALDDFSPADFTDPFEGAGVGPLLDVTDDGLGPVLDDASLGPVVDNTAADDSPTNGSATASPVGDDDGVESGLDPALDDFSPADFTDVDVPDDGGFCEAGDVDDS